MPWPRPIRRQFLRCAGVASARRGDHASGMATSRPSARTTWIASSVTLTSIAVGSGLTAEMGIPCLQKPDAVLDHHQSNSIELMRSKSARLRDAHGIKPELRRVVSVLDVDMRRFGAFQTIEEEAKAGNPKDGWHASR